MKAPESQTDWVVHGIETRMEEFVDKLLKLPPFTYLQRLKDEWYSNRTEVRDMRVFAGSVFGMLVTGIGIAALDSHHHSLLFTLDLASFGILTFKAGQMCEKYYGSRRN